MNPSNVSDDPDWRFARFGLIVTGHTEERCLPDLFRIFIQETGMCSFGVIRRVKQRSPRSKKRHLRMVGRGKKIPDKDVTDIGLTARQFLASDDSFVLLVDDLEADRSTCVQETFDRYRSVLDNILRSQSRRASVHFLVNMLEAYYFADSNAVNSILDINLDDYEGDVETIRNPKGRMKSLCPGFDVVEDGCQIIGRLSTRHVLSRGDACSSLRTMFAWVYKALGEPESVISQLLAGPYNDVTKAQICALSA